MNEDDIVDNLTRFGLSEKEALAYVTILQNGSTTIRVISDETDISKSYAYDIVGNLEERNLIQIDDHVQPTQLRAIPPSEGIENLVSQLHTIETQLDDLFDSESYEQQRFSIIKSRRTILAQLVDLIDSATEEIILALPASVLHRVEDSLQAAQDRSVFCMLLVTEYDGEIPISESIANVVQTWNAPAPVTLTTDRSDGIVSSADAVLNSNSDDYAIYHAEEHIVSSLFDSFIANYWPMGEQACVAEKGSLPRTFTSFRHAVFEATLYLMEGKPVTAEIEIRPTQSEDAFKTTTGTIIDVKQSLVRPFSNEFPTQESFVVETADETFTVGGSKAFLEDFEARDITLKGIHDA
ncbi:TrmB family transcriptional regulator [Haloarcula sp. CBA1130]|uniref:TrmB family transcriptional regulator n=1 Tax=unclassified Haloarcula TaxID=2624677 RepID=UPI001244B1D9|nr:MULTISPECIES: TrmB family transcriptional regulator sugar-binding domain-containing protein [unclassified Haloarcula]KAA9396598.1 TrmB family transcriptional regulator [Haloarcula sp. CBA1130]KAA9397433.1 TrmB family transcriptional regulator [Haloarcula sp. CBA1129]